ncbi:flavin reductase family protein [Nocardioides marmotae]|uniref:flavin reductase family protein n=1 Tax=Nocardioides marmotae TaxID=2663857 RepID=UPI0012B5FF6C|nr:flavin reductase family protein [Nocardioides marmotae]MBC9734465.1 flavin reductase family protein [Nocardioides marmotae]MTB85565.1 flavin reductase [Nocardioides marmotae]
MTAVDPVRFRETLGHYPTGVVVVTCIDDAGEPQGMVIGSFTSVSLDPPLVAYFPSKTSRTYQRVRTGSSFCVNVLGADQEDVCRLFATGAPDKFDRAAWRPAPSGAPILDGAVAWIDCAPHAIQDGGDHDIVLGRVTDLDVESAANPLLFFQGGYGRFSHRPLVAVNEDVYCAIRAAERGREHLQGLAEELGAEVNVIASHGEEMVYVATAVCPGVRSRTVLGAPFPILPPLGEVHVSGWPEDRIAEWVAKAPGDDDARARQLARVRQAQERGWTASLAGGRPEGELREALRLWSDPDLTPAQHREVTERIARATDYYQPFEPVDGEIYDLHSLLVAVPGPEGRVDLVVRVGQLRHGVDAATVRGWVGRAKQTARRLAGSE